MVVIQASERVLATLTIAASTSITRVAFRVNLTDVHTAIAAVVGGVVSAGVGAVVGGDLVARGLAQLAVAEHRPRNSTGFITGALGGIAAMSGARHAGSWWLLPALLVWAYGLAAAATCDAITQRVPTPLVRQAAVATAVLVLGAAASTGHWRWVALAATCSAAGAAIFAFCWRFLGAGFGDVRIAMLGGMGLADPTPAGIVAAVAAFTIITLSQGIVTLVRGGNRHTLFPYGPAIAVAFIVAAIV